MEPREERRWSVSVCVREGGKEREGGREREGERERVCVCVCERKT